MKCQFTFFLIGWSMMLPSFAASGAKQQVAATDTEHFDFAPAGIIRFENSYGYLNVEAWDCPEVEITVTKSSPDYDAGLREQGRLGLERVRVVTDRHSASELVISTTPPPPTTSLLDSYSKRHQGGVILNYEIHAPRETRLVIHHGKGIIFISGISGDIEATGSRGDLILMLPGRDSYSIDAKCRVGTVTSDFDGKIGKRLLLGAQFKAPSLAEGGRRIRLRMGAGSIAIQSIPPEALTAPMSLQY